MPTSCSSLSHLTLLHDGHVVQSPCHVVQSPPVCSHLKFPKTSGAEGVIVWSFIVCASGLVFIVENHVKRQPRVVGRPQLLPERLPPVTSCLQLDINMLFFNNTVRYNQYAPHAVLAGHNHPVNCMKANEDGTILASGGADGARVWDLINMAMIPRPVGASSTRGEISALTWVRRDDHPGEMLVCGTQNGQVFCWKHDGVSKQFEEANNSFQMIHPGKIMGLAFDSSRNRLAVAHQNSVIQVHNVDEKLHPKPVFSVSIDGLVPVAIAFDTEVNGTFRELVVLGVSGNHKNVRGEIATLHATTGEIIHQMQTGCLIGSADYNQRRGVFCLDDPHQGLALFRATDSARLRSCDVKRTKKEYLPRKTCFADDCNSLVTGSDHGNVYVYDRRSGVSVDVLPADTSDWVQTVTATELKGVSIIFAARSQGTTGNFPIKVWKKKAVSGRRYLMSFFIGLDVVLLIMVGWFLYQHFSSTQKLFTFF
ncbi:WD40-repeat-containing domain protein [Mycena epipterygia]|nr:WD40-repeat-containing domain protein [Mycena epipterygia]